MKTVSLFRHAKSSWDDPKLADFDRPLSARGQKAAAAMGGVMASAGIAPDLILCSPAVRTRETLKIASQAFTALPSTVYDQAFYLASSAALLTSLRALPADVAHVMLIGHNPGLHALALDLTGTGERAAMLSIARKFPTGALAVITFDIAEWRRLAVGEGRLKLFITPRSLGND